MKLFFVRHGKTRSNANKRIMGKWIDDKLLEEGRQEARKVINVLPTGLIYIYVSPLRRALETAKIINERLGLPFEIRQEIAERDFGKLSGIFWSRVPKLTEGKMTREFFLSRPEHDLSEYGGESKLEIRHRLNKFLSHLKSSHGEADKILVVSHGGVIRILYEILGLAQPNEGIQNASLHVFEIERHLH